MEGWDGEVDGWMDGWMVWTGWMPLEWDGMGMGWIGHDSMAVVDGWSRPNHMRSDLEDLQLSGCTRLPRGQLLGVGLRQIFYGSRRLPGNLHSVAKQASFSIDFKSDSGLFGMILGRFGRPKWRPKSIFGSFFSMLFSSAFWHRFFVDFGRLGA